MLPNDNTHRQARASREATPTQLRLDAGRRTAQHPPMEDSMKDQRIPLITGVVGHRDLHPDDAEALQTSLLKELQSLQATYAHTPIILLSPLVAGADQLAARTIAPSDFGDFVAVLPWSQGLHDDGYVRGGSAEKFQDALKRATTRICLPAADDVDLDALARNPDQCKTQYEQLGRYIARHSQLLFAFWDGRDRANSATCKVIRWHRLGESTPFASQIGRLDQPETGPVIHVPSRREADEEQPGDADAQCLAPERYARLFPQITGSIDRFNRDAERLGQRLSKQTTTAKGYLIPENEASRIPAHVRFTLNRYALADTLSQHFQRRIRRAYRLLLITVFLAAVCFEIFAHLAPGSIWALGGYLALAGLAALGVRVVRRKLDYHNRYIDYRALAEALRVQTFWKLAGLKDSVSDYYLRSYRSHLDWIRAALRAWSVQSREHDSACDDDCQLTTRQRLELVKSRWVADQADWSKRPIHATPASTAAAPPGRKRSSARPSAWPCCNSRAWATPSLRAIRRQPAP